MIGKALLTLAGATLLGIVFGALIGRTVGTIAPATYMSQIFGAQTEYEAVQMGTGFGAINGSILGIIVGGLALVYDLGHRFLSTRDS